MILIKKVYNAFDFNCTQIGYVLKANEILFTKYKKLP